MLNPSPTLRLGKGTRLLRIVNSPGRLHVARSWTGADEGKEGGRVPLCRVLLLIVVLT